MANKGDALLKQRILKQFGPQELTTRNSNDSELQQTKTKNNNLRLGWTKHKQERQICRVFFDSRKTDYYYQGQRIQFVQATNLVRPE